MTSPLLEVVDLDAGYGDFQALFRVAFSVYEGKALALVGANGAGKTTLLRTVAGAMAARSGSVRYGGADITGLAPYERIGRGIALVPEGRRLFPSLTAEENIQVGLPKARATTWPLARLYDTFPLLARVRRRRAGLLSGGEQQAVAIARALVSDPRLLLLDEISLGLAPAVVDGVYEVLDTLRAAGTTLVLVEQDLDRALASVDDVVCLLEGRVVLTSSTADVRRDDVVAAYFGARS